MNTPLRRTIFCLLLGSDDYMDAFEKISKLSLKGKQDREVVYVLVHCLMMEKTYNKYYELIAIKLCTFDYNMKFTFQYHLWDKFKQVGVVRSGRWMCRLVCVKLCAPLVCDVSLCFLFCFFCSHIHRCTLPWSNTSRWND
jgi:MA3 domain